MSRCLAGGWSGFEACESVPPFPLVEKREKKKSARFLWVHHHHATEMMDVPWRCSGILIIQRQRKGVFDKPGFCFVQRVPMSIQESVCLKSKNWFQTGGTARYYAAPATEAAVVDAIQFASTNGLKIVVLGEGANVLFSDEGVDGLVISPKNTQIVCDAEGASITAGAGVSMPYLINFALARNLLGLEEFSGIPGTVGGSVYINIHYFEFMLGQFLTAATVINLKSGTALRVDRGWFGFAYNQSTLQGHEWLLFDATFALRRGTDMEAAYARGRQHEIERHRHRRYPTARTCGSFFRNFLPDELNAIVGQKKVPFVAYYLEKAGVKGELRLGGASVSHLHANMIVTEEGATSADVVAVSRVMQIRVRELCGLTPQPECRLIGFDAYPLL